MAHLQRKKRQKLLASAQRWFPHIPAECWRIIRTDARPHYADEKRGHKLWRLEETTDLSDGLFTPEQWTRIPRRLKKRIYQGVLH